MSRIIGILFPKKSKPVKIRQDMHAQPDGTYQIQDLDKREKYENQKVSNKDKE